MIIKIAWADGVLRRYAAQIQQLSQTFPKVVPQEINKVGNRAKTVVVRNLTKQTGLDRAVIVKAVGSPIKASPGNLAYTMTTRGGNIRLKYFKPRETRRGVVAKPFGKRTLYPGTFLKGGKFPDRKTVEKFDGHVYRRLNPSGTRITQQKSGVIIPVEMTQGATLQAFEKVAAPLLERRIEVVIAKLLK